MDLHRVDAKMVKKTAFKAGIIGNSTDQPVLEQCLPMGLTVCSAGEGDIQAPAGRGLDEIIERVAGDVGHGSASFFCAKSATVRSGNEREST